MTRVSYGLFQYSANTTVRNGLHFVKPQQTGENPISATLTPQYCCTRQCDGVTPNSRFAQEVSATDRSTSDVALSKPG
jgi:hypothetical protein